MRRKNRQIQFNAIRVSILAHFLIRQTFVGLCRQIATANNRWRTEEKKVSEKFHEND